MHHSLLKKGLSVLALAIALAVNARAQSPFGDLSGTGQVAYESQYVFRGKKIADSSIQPKGEIGLQVGADGNAYVGAWSNQPISRRTSAPGPDQSNEIDIFGGLIYNLPVLTGVQVDIGDTYYWYPEAGGQTLPTNVVGSSRGSRSDETYIGFSYNTGSLPMLNTTGLVPAVYLYHDWILDANVVEASLKTTWDLSHVVGMSGLTLSPTILGGWYHANRTWGDEFSTGVPGSLHNNWRNGYMYWKAGFELDYQISDGCYLFGELDYEGNNDGKVGGYQGINPQLGGTPNSVWFGAGLKFRK